MMPELSTRSRRKTKKRLSVQQAFSEPQPTTVSVSSFQKKRKNTNGFPATRAAKRKAVLVGVSEPDSEEELTPEERALLTLRAHDDVKAMQMFLIGE
jgi:hypothetical protein